jgi:hypothetical protein
MIVSCSKIKELDVRCVPTVPSVAQRSPHFH